MPIDPSTVFSTFDWIQLAKIRQHRQKEHLEISEDAKFERDLWKTNENIALQSRQILTHPRFFQLLTGSN